VKAVWVIFFILYISATAAAQKGFLLRKFDTKDGLSHQQVNCIFQDSRGFIWAGTSHGLNFYDGIRFTSFYHSATDTNSLPHNIILSIAEDKQGKLWIGTQQGFCRFDFFTKKFTGYSSFNKGPYYLNLENCYVYAGKNDNIWIGHNRGITELNPVTNRQKNYSVMLRAPGLFNNPFVTSFMEDANGFLWASTSYGVYRKKREEEHFSPVSFSFTNDKKAMPPACTKLTAGTDGTIYCGSWGSSLLVWDSQKNCFNRIAFTDKTSSNDNVFDILFKDSSVFIATEAGMIVTDNESVSGKKPICFSRISYSPDEPFSLPSGTISGLVAEKNSGSIWLATHNGIVQFQDQAAFILPQSYTHINGWVSFSAAPSADGKKLYLLTGLDIIEYDTVSKSFSVNPFNVKGKFCSRLLKGKKNYWLTSKDGLYKFDLNMRSPQLLTNNALPGNLKGFNSIFEDSKGTIWLGAAGRKGVVTWNPEQNIWTQQLDDSLLPITLAGKTIEAFAEDPQGNIWIASNPLVRYNRLTGLFEKIYITATGMNADELNSSSSVYSDKKGNTWVGTYSGLSFFANSGTASKTIALPPGIASRINGITEDNNGNLWLITPTGLVSYNITSGSFRLFNKQKGLPENDLGNLIRTLPDGKILVSYNGGICFIDPALNNTREKIPPPQWISIQVDNRAVPAITGSNPVSLRYNQGITFNFISPDYSNAQQNQYACLLEGIDKDWNFISTNTSQRFANLPAGRYTFKVKAGDSDGNWNETAAAFTFIVKPVFWKTWWFISAAAVLLAFFVFAIYRYRLRQAIALEKMRTRIATDLHDDIGATLSSISFYSEAVKQKVKNKLPDAEPILEKMGETSRSMVGNMSDIVWAINPKNDAAGSLFKRMHDYASELCQLKNLALRFENEKSADKKSLDIETRKNIYLIFKEAVNNALKYSGCSELKIKIEPLQQRLRMSIADNGCGFDPGMDKDGNGLPNMKARAEELKGGLKIISSPGNGTVIELDCPLP
jgi:signal transduction histidine kinase/ligand-binding sensor domain-containing protein